jgi:hypothetical protein
LAPSSILEKKGLVSAFMTSATVLSLAANTLVLKNKALQEKISAYADRTTAVDFKHLLNILHLSPFTH